MEQTVKQLSIFLENKIGSLYETMNVLSEANIRIIAATVADTTEFGILRIITDSPEQASRVLGAAQKNTSTTDVIVLSCESTASAFYDKLRVLSANGVVIEYFYCFSVRDRAYIIMRVNDNERALRSISEAGLETISAEDLLKI
ncbi:MAG: acetolactate synthase [Rikenellaceae bacterium]